MRRLTLAWIVTGAACNSQSDEPCTPPEVVVIQDGDAFRVEHELSAEVHQTDLTFAVTDPLGLVGATTPFQEDHDRAWFQCPPARVSGRWTDAHGHHGLMGVRNVALEWRFSLGFYEHLDPTEDPRTP